VASTTPGFLESRLLPRDNHLLHFSLTPQERLRRFCLSQIWWLSAHLRLRAVQVSSQNHLVSKIILVSGGLDTPDEHGLLDHRNKVLLEYT